MSRKRQIKVRLAPKIPAPRGRNECECHDEQQRQRRGVRDEQLKRGAVIAAAAPVAIIPRLEREKAVQRPAMQPGVGGENEVARGENRQPRRQESPVQYFRKSGIRTICWVSASSSWAKLADHPPKMRRARLEAGSVTFPRGNWIARTRRRCGAGAPPSFSEDGRLKRVRPANMRPRTVAASAGTRHKAILCRARQDKRPSPSAAEFHRFEALPHVHINHQAEPSAKLLARAASCDVTPRDRQVRLAGYAAAQGARPRRCSTRSRFRPFCSRRRDGDASIFGLRSHDRGIRARGRRSSVAARGLGFAPGK